jgi:pentose-5-phosphate-3-epimerase
MFVLAFTQKPNFALSCIGSNVIVAGTAIFGAGDPSQVIQELKDAVDIAQAKASK